MINHESKKFYVATGLKNADMARVMAVELTNLGLQDSYDWRRHGSVLTESRFRKREVAQKELDGVRHADVVVVIMPGGRGTHVELGAALVTGAFVVLVDDDNKLVEGSYCVFHDHPRVHKVTAMEQALYMVRGWLAAKVE